METKFVLHGGFSRGEKQEDDAFFNAILETAPGKAKVLLVYFAQEADRVAKNQLEDMEQFEKNKGDRTLSFEVATEASFEEQVKQAGIIYLHGGHSGMLRDALKKFSHLKELFLGKIVAGDSAGANVLCAVFYSDKIGVSGGLV